MCHFLGWEKPIVENHYSVTETGTKLGQAECEGGGTSVTFDSETNTRRANTSEFEVTIILVATLVNVSPIVELKGQVPAEPLTHHIG